MTDPKRINVLVYHSADEGNSINIKDAIKSLKTHLGSNYAVQQVNHSTF